MTTYKIIHYTTTNPIGNTVHKTNVFNKTELQGKFDTLVKQLKSAYTAKGHKVKSKHN